LQVILISGKAQHGKDSTANILKRRLEEQGKKVLITHYGDLVKYVCKTFFKWDENKDEYGRTLLQHVGTDKIRKKFPDFWVEFIIDILTVFPNEWDYVLIPDCRFVNEIELFKDYGFNYTTIRVVRFNFKSPLTTEQQQHISEIALDNYNFDYYIASESGLDKLETEVMKFMEEMVDE